MNNVQFRIFMDLLMVCDPWPLIAGDDEMTDLANEEARRRGYDGWVEAYHKYQPPELVGQVVEKTDAASDKERLKTMVHQIRHLSEDLDQILLRRTLS